jgi:drug/metabolite transporter (DMT)-like permease
MGQVDTRAGEQDIAQHGAANLRGTPVATLESARGRVTTQGFTVYDSMLLLMVVVWAANPAAIKWALQYIDPLAFNALRFALASLLPVGMLLASREGFRWQRGDGWKILALGLIGHGVYQMGFILGINNTLAGNAALILSINPAFVVAFGALMGFERARAYTWVGVSITLAGAALVVLGTGSRWSSASASWEMPSC